MPKTLSLSLLLSPPVAYGNAQSVRHATHVVPNGKGWGVETAVWYFRTRSHSQSGRGHRERNQLPRRSGHARHGEYLLHLVRELDQWTACFRQPDH